MRKGDFTTSRVMEQYQKFKRRRRKKNRNQKRKKATKMNYGLDRK